LLEVLSGSVPDDIWIRLMYAYPGRVTRRLASVMSRAPNIIPYVDMPLQHGSESVLKRMKRPSLKKANESLSMLKEAMPDISLRTTFIVGFPGETDREFEELLDFIEKWQFNHVGAFNYSPQVGTPATSLPDATVDTQVATERFGEVMTLAQEISHRHTKALVGRSIDVLIESEEPGQNADGEFISIGRSYRDAPEVDGLVFVKGAYHQGDKISAEVSGALPYDVFCNSGQSG
jgi:ribosomal protein S12 methylthiotransferase